MHSGPGGGGRREGGWCPLTYCMRGQGASPGWQGGRAWPGPPAPCAPGAQPSRVSGTGSDGRGHTLGCRVLALGALGVAEIIRKPAPKAQQSQGVRPTRGPQMGAPTHMSARWPLCLQVWPPFPSVPSMFSTPLLPARPGAALSPPIPSGPLASPPEPVCGAAAGRGRPGPRPWRRS